VTELNSTLINSTMAYLLDRFKVPVDARFRYREIQTFENAYVSLDGESRILSVTLYVNADNTTSFFGVLLTPSSDYFAESQRATQISLIVIFLCVVPVLVIVTAICMHFTLSKPTNVLANAMLAISKDFKFEKATRTSFSPIRVREKKKKAFP
jgi:hypothetical protein